MNSGRGVRVLSPGGAIAPTGTWSVGARAGDFVFVAGMRGINPTNNSLVQGEEASGRRF
jgi:2-iminobutanoate/2-iminopropanoate deaminase